ncbi:hypothetical protein DPMN_073546 [Dreissena polymorpha]|uniref:Uncharacterized protein n=1 Tax=Dreissena polymorpha TaxID=45954 RepID=A0A9D4HB76_DREPO|nr:hypothetical protein DPMN_073546 [Dreissena polymorpha]
MYPFIEKVIKCLTQSLMDTMPEVRCEAARALGTMVKCIGSQRSEDLKHWLFEVLKSYCSAEKRSGAAEGTNLSHYYV